MVDQVYESKTKSYRDLTPEEEAQRIIDQQDFEAKVAQEQAESARLSEIKGATFVSQIEDAMRGKTFAEINTFIDGMSQAQRDNAFKGLLLKWALRLNEDNGLS